MEHQEGDDAKYHVFRDSEADDQVKCHPTEPVPIPFYEHQREHSRSFHTSIPIEVGTKVAVFLPFYCMPVQVSVLSVFLCSIRFLLSCASGEP